MDILLHSSVVVALGIQMVPVLLMNACNARFVEPLSLGEAQSQEVQPFSIQDFQFCRGRFFLEHKQLESKTPSEPSFKERKSRSTYVPIVGQNVYLSPLGYYFSDALRKRP